MLPFYFKNYGVEFLGVIGIFAVLQAVLTVFELGMRSAMVREFAKATNRVNNSLKYSNIFYAFEIVLLGISLLILIFFFTLSDWIAVNFIRTVTFDVATLKTIFKLMSFLLTLRYIEAVYVSFMISQARYREFNFYSSFLNLSKAGLVIIFVKNYSNDVIDYMWLQIFFAFISVAIYVLLTYKYTKINLVSRRYSLNAFLRVKKNTSCLLWFSIITMLMSNIDKLFLARILRLEDYGGYVIVATAANVTLILISSVTQIAFSRFTEIYAKNNFIEFEKSIRLFIQFTVVSTCSVSIMLIVNADFVLYSWLGDEVLVNEYARLFALILIGNFIYGQVAIQQQILLAFRKENLLSMNNLTFLLLYLICLCIFIPIQGVNAVGYTWIIFNAFYFSILIYQLHKVYPKFNLFNIVFFDIFIPVFCALAAMALSHGATSDEVHGAPANMLLIFVLFVFVQGVSTLSAKDMRLKIIILLLKVKVSRNLVLTTMRRFDKIKFKLVQFVDSKE
jgi:O-antigen/teichoic acid export membrane protein